MVKKQVRKSMARTRDIIKVIKGDMTDEEYANKYTMTIEHVENFKKLYLMINKIDKKIRKNN